MKKKSIYIDPKDGYLTLDVTDRRWIKPKIYPWIPVIGVFLFLLNSKPYTKTPNRYIASMAYQVIITVIILVLIQIFIFPTPQ